MNNFAGKSSLIKKNSITIRFGKGNYCLFWNEAILFGNENLSFTIGIVLDRQRNQTFWYEIWRCITKNFVFSAYLKRILL